MLSKSSFIDIENLMKQEYKPVYNRVIKPSSYQKKIFSSVMSTDDNIVIKATAGSGKTTTIVEASKLINQHKKIIFLAFNKSIVEELKTKLPYYVECRTLHSLGFEALSKHYDEKLHINQYKILNFIKNEYAPSLSKKEQIRNFKLSILDIINFMRFDYLQNDEEYVERIIEDRGINVCDDNQTKATVKAFNSYHKYNKRMINGTRDIDFTDMIYLPVYFDMDLPKYDVVFVDEVQDLSVLQYNFIQKILKRGGRTIVVGDPNQAIYGFCGASSTSFDKFCNQKYTKMFNLPVSYRCAKKVVELAQGVFPNDIKAFVDNEDGIVRNGEKEEIEINDVVLCRNTKPLVELYFTLLRRGIKAHIKGKDMHEGISGLISKIEDMSLSNGIDYLFDMLYALREDLLAEGIKKYQNHPKYISLDEKITIIHIIAHSSDNCNTVDDLKKKVKEIFFEGKEGVSLMTIHKSKGLEFDKVFLYKMGLLPSKHAKTKEQLQQEQNLKFVAYTRAKKEVVFID